MRFDRHRASRLVGPEGIASIGRQQDAGVEPPSVAGPPSHAESRERFVRDVTPRCA